MGGGGERWALWLWVLWLWVPAPCGAAMDECAEERSGRAQRCMPEFVNAAFNATVLATHTCGAPAEEYCVQTGVTGVTQSCHLCDAAQPHLSHGAAFLTDYNSPADATWWQSRTMLAGVQHPTAVNLTLHLGKDGEREAGEGIRGRVTPAAAQAGDDLLERALRRRAGSPGGQRARSVPCAQWCPRVHQD
ncbi:hypothetical protein DUI87_14621 [Hirundo rustica rustica]|uniref:Laminin N-terminal domain-containing protein n=1 Tax=Hirundo rustica rustica TaxID=333673 RepID=A0A3M0KME1_HIRRU|nr:hypothetical protein DUI87_14621 [Hirundo rustica rustica]